VVKSKHKSVELVLPNYRLFCYKDNHDGDTASLGVMSPTNRLQSIHLYLGDLPIDEAVEFFRQSLEMLARLPVRSKKQRRLKGLSGGIAPYARADTNGD
jgi:hypothetical protein